MRKFMVLVVVVVLAGGALWLRTTSPAATSTTTTTTIAPTTTTIPGPPRACPASGTAGSSPGPFCFAWHAQDTWSGTTPSVYTTSYALEASQPGIVAYASWIRTSTTDLALYPGYEGPGPTALSRGPEMVPPSAYPRLLATFNSGFYEKDGAAGFYTNHTLYFPLVHGLATVVRYTDGKVDVIAWAGGARPGANVVMARQNLSLLVAAGAATPASANNASWGITLHGVPAVWRTALGVDANGNLVYVAASDVTSTNLATIMVQLGVVRAMQLDINPEWPIFVTYAGPGAVGPTLDVPNPNQITRRFLYPSTKDFFAVFTSARPGEPQPW